MGRSPALAERERERMTDISKDDFRFLGPKILGRVIGVSFLGQWAEDQVYEAFKQYMILIPKGFTVRITTYWVKKVLYMGFGSNSYIEKRHPLDNRVKESRLGESGSFQITIAKFISPDEVKRLEDEAKNRLAKNQDRGADPREAADRKGNETGSKDSSETEPALKL